MNSTESIFFWIGTLALALAFFMSILSLIFRKDKAYKFSQLFLFIGFLSITVFGIIRWSVTGHPPFVTRFESMVNSVWFVLLIFFLIQRKIANALLIILPLSLFSFLLMGWASSLPTDASQLSTALDNVWLFIHASFATSGAASFLVAASFSVIFLLGEDRLQLNNKLTSKIPEFSKLQKSITNFLIFGLILWGVMIISGAIWAHSAWGRYWAWDPIELWSLISWLLYGFLIHARLTLKFSQKLFAVLTIVAALTVLFALWGVGYVYETIHSYG